ncbi:MAG: hypothetical protein R2764_07305 [Bacteroidales bacterium]
MLPSLIYFLFIASFFAWWGGWTYGPRFLSGLVIICSYEGIRFISKNPHFKTLFYMLIVFGLACAFLAKATIVYTCPTEEYNPILNLAIPAFINGNFNPNNLLTLFFHVKPVYSFIVFVTLFLGGLGFLVYLHPNHSK